VVRAVLWDNDGVLVDTERLYFQANREVMAEHGFELSRELFADYSLRQGRSVFDLLEGLSGADFDDLRARRNARYELLIAAGVRVFDGVRETLEALRGRVPMAIVTSSNAAHFEAIHEQTDLLHYFDFVLKNGDYVHHKPHPEPYLTAARRLALDPSDCVVVEDSERGVEAAHRAGMRCIAIPNALASDGDFGLASLIAESVHEVPRLLDQLAGRSPRTAVTAPRNSSKDRDIPGS
jgi:HAD superfamily hydrolase (TIGR01509 family)